MEHYKISKLLNDLTVSKFVTRKRIKANDLSGVQYSTNKNKRFKTPIIRSTFCGYSDKCIIVKCTTYLLAAVANENDKAQKDVVFKNNAPFRSCISQINNIFIENAEDLDAVMSIHNLLEYSDNYSRTPRSLWN